LREDVYSKASQDPRDKGKTGLFEVQSPIGAALFPSLPRLKAMLWRAVVRPRNHCNLPSQAVADEAKQGDE
jgi:hypothetical protein